MYKKQIGLLILILLIGMILTNATKAELVGWWKLDGNADDASGYNHPGTLFGDPQWVDGKIRGAFFGVLGHLLLRFLVNGGDGDRPRRRRSLRELPRGRFFSGWDVLQL